MNEEERFEIALSQEDVQTIIDCYEKDIKYINQLEQENQRLKENKQKTKSYYIKELNKHNARNERMPVEAVEMFNLLEGNK